MLPSPLRNAPCPCGSGKRFKECHGTLRTLSPEPATPGDPATTARSLENCRGAIDRAPSDVAAWNQLGEILRATDSAAAEAAWRRAVELAPDNAEAHFHLGNLCRERGEPDAARTEYERALASAPDHAGSINNLGLVLEALGDRDRAEACYRRVLAADPQDADALGNLASLLFAREAFRQSSTVYEHLCAVRRDIPAPVWVRRALAHQRAGDLAAAETCFREAARLLPDDVTIQLNVGTVCSEQQRYADAESAWLRAMELRPENLYALSMLAHGRQLRCDWRELAELHAKVNRSIESDPAEQDSKINPFTLLSMPSSPRAQLRGAQRWARGCAPASPAARPRVAVAPGERLRVGFVSSDFRNHPMAHVSMEVWERIDRDRFETFAYGIRERHLGPIGQRIERAFDHFADVSDAPVGEIVRRIHADRIAILLDLNGYTKHSREAIFALRPAPIQINYIGYPGTLGADWYDYICVDRFGAPEASQTYYTERLLHLPHMSLPSDTRRAPKGPPPTRAECGLPADAFVFCSFNNAYKILPDVFAIWMRLLHAVPGSVLWFVQSGPEVVENLRREARRAGIDPGRLIFAPRLDSVESHVARIAAADLFVDSYPYGAHTTANDALLAGLPVITRAGATLASRIAGSQLHAIGLPELVTANGADYEALARRLAHDRGELASLRARLATNRKTYPLFDMARYTRDLEESLWQVFRGLPTLGPELSGK
jgi:predicted O-linked N-acetylglucosamine transferase (SPINDLY family)